MNEEQVKKLREKSFVRTNDKFTYKGAIVTEHIKQIDQKFVYESYMYDGQGGNKPMFSREFNTFDSLIRFLT